jgi:acyl carrier protein
MRDTSAEAVRGWLIERVADYVEIPAAQVDPDLTFVEIGLDSVYSLTLCGEAEDWYGCELDPTATRDYTTITALAGHLSDVLRAGTPR